MEYIININVLGFTLHNAGGSEIYLSVSLSEMTRKSQVTKTVWVLTSRDTSSH